MNTLVDTPVWSLAWRRSPKDLNVTERSIVDRLVELVQVNEARIIGPIRQELLSGVKTEAQFERLRTLLKPFPDEPLTTEDFEDGARAFNFCRTKGLESTTVDILLCAAALRRSFAVYTLDSNVQRCCRVLNVQLI